MGTRALIAGLGMVAALPAAAHRGGPNIMEEEQLIRDARRLRGILHRLIEATDAFVAAGPGGTPR
jgi:hypothetical protein